MIKTDRDFGRVYDLAVLSLALCVFLVLTCYQIRLPGLHTDEAMEVLPAMQILRGQTVECYKDVCLELFGQRFPVMIYEYIAAVNAYLSLPFFALFGVNVTSLRLVPIVQSVLAMVFAYLFAREYANRRVATLALLLLAVNPSFVFWSRQGVFVTSVTIPISMAGMWSLWQWRQGGKARYLYLGAFLFGLGTSAKLLFWWMIAGVGLSAALLNVDRLVECWRERSLAPLQLRLGWRDVLIAGLLFALGLTPLIFFNLRTGSTIHYIRDNVFATSYYDVDNTNLRENLRERIKELGSVINGETFFYLGGRPYASWRYTSVFVIAVGVLGFSLLARKRPLLQDTIDENSQSGTMPAAGRACAVSTLVHGNHDTLYTWITIAAVVLPGYALYRLVGLKPRGRVVPLWYWLTLIVSLPAAALGIAFRARGRARAIRAEKRGTPQERVQRTLFHRAADRWMDLSCVHHVLVALCTALLLMLFMYLAWKLAGWQTPWLYAMGISVLLLAPWLRARAEARQVLFPASVLAIALAASSFTPTGLLFTHLALLVPWPILVIALAVDLIARRSGLDRLNLAGSSALSLGTAFTLALTGMLIYDDLRVDVAYHRDLKRIGGIGDHTSASYALVEHLQQENASQVVAMDWGIQDVIQFLSEGTINPPQLSSYEDIDQEDGAFALRVREHLDEPDTVYVFHVGAVFKNRWEAFQQIAAEEGRTPVEIRIVYDRAAIPIFRLVRVP